MQKLATFIDVILPIRIPKYYTYAVPFEQVEEIALGKRVVVQFGRSKYYTALVRKIHNRKPEEYNPKLIESIIDEQPIVSDTQFEFWEWIATYYMCSVGEVMNAALPGAMKLSSETKVVLNPGFDGDFTECNDKEYLIAEALQLQGELSIKDVQAILEQKTVHHIIKGLLTNGIAVLKEELKDQYKPKVEPFITLNPIYEDENLLRQAFEDLGRAPKQLDVLMAYIHLTKTIDRKLRKADLIKKANSTGATVKRLVEKEVFIETKEVVSRLKDAESDDISSELNDEQATALNDLKEIFKEKNTALLHGVTASGKTHVYIKYIEEVVNTNKQVLFLLPEIALTAQLVNRIRAVFGNKVGLYHSKFNNNERVEIWHKVLSGEYKIILGARSALFLPFKDLGLIIVDESHDRSYKQYDPAPRYNARDMASVLAVKFGAKVILGSATPSIESQYNVEQGKFGKATLYKRYGDVQMPQIEMVDLADKRKRKQMHTYFSDTLLQAIESALEQKQQVILFQNRRGFAQYMTCETCGWVPYCHQCDVSLTYHKFMNTLVCHYCGSKKNIQTNCEACGSDTMNIKGYGTEKIEDEIQLLLPDAKVDRFDLDTTRGKHGHERILSKFENKEIDILVGTQMVTKGLDFENVSLAGIVNADNLFSFPDFRAIERAFQLISQVGGRAGRRSARGKVIIQTSQPNHSLFSYIQNNDSVGFSNTELASRKQFLYPPYCSIINITIRHKKGPVVDRASKYFVNELKKAGIHYLGPAIPMVSMIRNNFLRDVVIKLPKSSAKIKEVKVTISGIQRQIKGMTDFKSISFLTNVDP